MKVKYSGLISFLIYKARAVVREINSQDDLTFLRIRTKNHEILVAPSISSNDQDKKESGVFGFDYLLIVIQNQNFEK